MADFTLTRNDKFPNTTSVKAYAVSNWLNGEVKTDAAPVGSSANTQTMTAGTLTFTGLTKSTRYVAYALVGAVHTYVAFTAAEDTAEGTSIANTGENETVTGDWTFSDPVTVATPTASGHATTKGYVDTADSTHVADTTAVHGITDTAVLVKGPATAVGDNVATYDSTTGKLIKDSGLAAAQVALLNAGTAFTVGQTISHADGLVLSGNGGKDTLSLSNTTANVGITIGGDVEIYRTGTNAFKTDDAFTVAANFEVTGTTTVVGIAATLAATTTDAYTAKVTGDSATRFVANADGKMEWGDGTSAVDTNLYRASASTLKTDNEFRALDIYVRPAAASQVYVGNLTSYTFLRSLTPTLYWPLNVTYGATDQSGNSRNGTGVGGVSIGAYSGSPISGETTATDFDGSDDTITSAYAVFANGVTRTFTGWAYRDTSSGSDALIGSAGATPVTLELSSGSTDVVWKPANSAATTWIAAWPGNGVWVHWALVFNETTNDASLYINGVLVSTQANTDAYDAAVGNLEVGIIQGVYSPFDGKMAHVAVFERALTSAEILDLYRAGTVDGSAGVRLGSAADTNLYRSAANTLRTDDTLVVALELNPLGDINHDGSNVGFFGVAPTTKPTAYTQTYATADKTHATPTVGSDISTAGSGLAAYGYAQAQADAIPVAINALKADHADLAQLVNAVIDDLQILGLAG